jgi:membrane protein DedA with SNARE-associated domain
MITSDFTGLFHSASGDQPLQAGIIVIGTFVLEDAATLLAAMQVAAGALSLPLALCSLYAGIILGDLGLYGLGRLSASNGWARRLVGRRRRKLGQQWVSGRMFPVVIISRFVPGLRLPTYTSLGFLRAPLRKFAAAVVIATLLWTTGLFFISFKLGILMKHYLGVWRWAGLAVLLVVIVIVGRFATRLYNQRTSS